MAAKAGSGKYVVLVDALVARYGKEKDEVGQYLQGHVVELDADVVDIDKLIALKAIAPNDGKPKTATSARAAALASGSEADPVRVPVNAYTPEVPFVQPEEDAKADAENAGAKVKELATESAKPEAAVAPSTTASRPSR